MTLILLCQASERSVAEARLSGTQDRTVLETNNAPLSEIVSALQNTFAIKVTLTGVITQKFTGTYSGSIRQIISHLLTGKDYILRADSDGVSIVLLGNGSPDTAARTVWQPPQSATPRPTAPFNLTLPRAH
jgi:hypothetical protein